MRRCRVQSCIYFIEKVHKTNLQTAVADLMTKAKLLNAAWYQLNRSVDGP